MGVPLSAENPMPETRSELMEWAFSTRSWAMAPSALMPSSVIRLEHSRALRYSAELQHALSWYLG